MHFIGTGLVTFFRGTSSDLGGARPQNAPPPPVALGLTWMLQRLLEQTHKKRTSVICLFASSAKALMETEKHSQTRKK